MPCAACRALRAVRCAPYAAAGAGAGGEHVVQPRRALPVDRRPHAPERSAKHADRSAQDAARRMVVRCALRALYAACRPLYVVSRTTVQRHPTAAPTHAARGRTRGSRRRPALASARGRADRVEGTMPGQRVLPWYPGGHRQRGGSRRRPCRSGGADGTYLDAEGRRRNKLRSMGSTARTSSTSAASPTRSASRCSAVGPTRRPAPRSPLGVALLRGSAPAAAACRTPRCFGRAAAPLRAGSARLCVCLCV